MKFTFKLMAIVSVASLLFGSQAFAGNSLGQQRLAERNAAYFKQNGIQHASVTWAASAAPSEPSSPHHRMGQRNAEYFSGNVSNVAGYQPAKEPAHSHPTKR